MKKFNKSGHLQGNTDIPRHAGPFIHGNVTTNSSGYIASLQALSVPWFREFNVTTEAGSITLVLSNVNTASGSTDPGHLQTIVTFINNHSSNNIVTVSISDGALLIQSDTAGSGSFLRVDGAVNYPNSAIDFGLPIHPHSQATVSFNDLKTSAINSLTQKNPQGTSFIAKGEDRSSLNYNRALYSVATNTDSNQAMLDKPIARLVSFKLPVDSNGTNSRFVVDTATNTVKAINMSSAISDALSASLSGRVLVGTLTKNSTQRDIRRYFQVTDTEQKELLYGNDGLPVRVSGVVTGPATGSNPVGPFVLDSTPASTMADSSAVGDSKNVLSIDIPRVSSTQSKNITKIHDSYTIECSSATFIDASGNNLIFAGDKLTIAGSAKNNGDYLVENVISPTMVEVKPLTFNSIQELDMSDSTGTVSVTTGGMFVKDVTLYITERIQLPLPSDVYITMPMENTIGTLDEDALISQDNIEVPYWILKNIYLEKSLDGVYSGISTNRKAAGYYINADVRPVITNIQNYRENTSGTVIKNVQDINIVVGNIVKITLTSSDIFTDDDVGRFIRFNTTDPTGVITDSKLLNQELVVIVSILDGKTVKVKRVSRDSADLPVTSNIPSIDIVSEDATPFLPGASISVSTDPLSIGGNIRILETMSDSSKIEADAFLTSAELVRLHKLSDTVKIPIFSITTSGDTINTSVGIDGSYLNLSYPISNEVRSTALLLRVYNGPNAGWYTVKSITNALPPVITVSSLKAASVTFANTSVQQYASIYRVAEGSRISSSVGQANSTITQRSISAAANESDYAIGLITTWKGEGNGIVIHSNYHDNTADSVYAGYGSRGANLYSYNGPGTRGLDLYGVGFQGFTNSNVSSTAESAINASIGLGGYPIRATSQAYHLDPNSYTLTVPNFSYKGSSTFISETNDAAAVVSMSTSSIPTSMAASASLVVINRDDNYAYGKSSAALAVYGNVYSESIRVTSEYKNVQNIYTEHSMSSVNVFTSEPENLDATDTDVFNNIIGSSSVIARSHYSSGVAFTTKVLRKDFGRFNVPHDLVLECNTSTGAGETGSILSFFGPDYFQDAIGSFVFFPAITDSSVSATAFTAINSSVDNTLHSLPFKLTDSDVSIQGCKIGFKIVACNLVQGDINECYFALSAGKDGVLNSDIATSTLAIRISTIFFRSRFSIQGDIQNYTRIGGTTRNYYRYEDNSSSDSHKNPVLFSKELDQTITPFSENLLTTGLGDGTSSSTAITDKGYPAADSSLVKSSSQLQLPFVYNPTTDINYQSPDLAHKISDKVVPGFAADVIGKHGQTINYGSNSIFVSSSTGNINLAETVVVASSSKHRDKYKGGGKKLVLSPYSAGATAYTLSIKVGTNHMKSPTGIRVDIRLANSALGNKTLTATLKQAGTSVQTITSKSIDLYSSAIPTINLRSYTTLSFIFTKDELSGIRSINEGSDIPDMYIVISGLDCTPGYFDHTGLDFLTTQARRSIGIATSATTEQTGTQTVNNITTPLYERTDDRNRYPDLWYIYDVSVKYDKKQAALSTGLDIDGAVQPRSIRMLAPVTGYQVVGPASVDLLQNSEYGNSKGHDILYDGTLATHNTTNYITNDTTLGTTSTNLEGRDVGLVPLWYPFYPTAWDLDLLHLQTPDDALSYDLPHTSDWDSSPWVDLYSVSNTYSISFVGSSGVTNGGSTDGEQKYYMGLSSGGGADSSDKDNYFSLFTFAVRTSGAAASTDVWSGAGIIIQQEKLSYVVPSVITRFYRPKFDRTSFFRKGVHSASIHAHIPYFDPLFYWLNTASSVTYGRRDIAAELNRTTGNQYSEVSGVQTQTRFDSGSFRQHTGTGGKLLRDSKVNPDAFIPSGKTGFVVPIEPPHGSKLTTIDLNISFRPMCTRKGTDRRDSTDLHTTYGVWHDIPTTNTSPIHRTGDYWMDKAGWDQKEGYLVRLWRHTLFDEGTLFGENPDSPGTNIFTNKHKNMEGNASLLYEKTVTLRGTVDGGVGDPSALIDTSAHDIQEGVSKLKIVLDAEDTFIVDRSVYSYFVTIEFYTGIRKIHDFNNAANETEECYSIPGLQYGGHMDMSNTDHFPYMWTPAFPGRSPRRMSTIYGNDPAVRWQGYWSPYPHSAALRSSFYENTIYRRHPLNSRGDAQVIHTTPDPNDIFTVGDSDIAPTIDASTIASSRDYYPIKGYSASSAASYLLDITNNNNGLDQLLNFNQIKDHTIWYPVIKFRGLRISYEMDRPGHGGWGG